MRLTIRAPRGKGIREAVAKVTLVAETSEDEELLRQVSDHVRCGIGVSQLLRLGMARVIDIDSTLLRRYLIEQLDRQLEGAA